MLGGLTLDFAMHLVDVSAAQMAISVHFYKQNVTSFDLKLS